jgi:hypothetical protein
MPSGSANAQLLKAIIDKAEQGKAVLGTAPGTFSVVPTVAAVASAPTAPTAQGAVLSPGEAALVQNAVSRANDAGPVLSAAPDAKGAAGIIDAVVKGLTNVANTPQDIKTLVAGATASLHWWGWTLSLNETATVALESLLTTDIGGLAAVATALAAISPVLAAVAAIVTAVATGLGAWIKAEDAAKKGVSIHGYLWVGVWVQPA